MTISNGQVTMTGTAALIVSPTPAGCQAVIKNIGTKVIYIGASDSVTPQDGFQIGIDQTVVLILGPNESIYGRSVIGEPSKASYITTLTTLA